MFVRKIAICGITLILLSGWAGMLAAQTHAAPTAYTVTLVNSLFGPPGEWMKTSRLGNKAFVDQVAAAKAADPAATHIHSIYDLAAHRSFSWNWPDSSAGCSSGTFSGDWGDPFTGADELAGAAVKQAATETILGVQAEVLNATVEGVKVKAWVDPKTGLLLKEILTQGSAAPRTVIEVKSVSYAAPPASVFTFPPSCAATVAAPPPPTPAELIAAETGDSSANFVNANYGPGSKNTCTIALHVVQAKTMAPITRKFQVAIDTTYDQNSPTPPHYEFGTANDGTSTFSGGGIHEITNQIHNGVLRIVNPPAYFNLAVNVITPGQGAGSGLVYRQCFGPVTNLYVVMADQADPFKGSDYLYAKAGKYATAPK